MHASFLSYRSCRPHLAAGAFLLLCGCSGDDLLLPDSAPAQVRVVSGDGQTALAGDPVRNPLIVEVLDGGGRPIPGATIVFEFVDPPRGAEISAPATQTDASGRASAEVTLGNAVGDQPVVARLDRPGSDLSVQFLLTAIQRSGGGGGGGGDDDGAAPPPASPPPAPAPPTDGSGGDNGGGDDDGGAGPAPPASPQPPDDGGGNGKGKGKDKDKDDDHSGPGRGDDDDDDDD